jgi:hypothetical protein
MSTMHQLPPVAPGPEKQQLDARLGLWRNAVAELADRTRNLARVIPEQREAEETFLRRWERNLTREETQLRLAYRELQQRQVQTGILVPQADGTFVHVPPPTPTHVMLGRQAGERFQAAGFRSKTGVIGGVLILLGLVLAWVGFVPGVLFLFVGIGLVIAWFVGSMKGDRGGSSGGATGAAAHAQMQAIRAQEERDAANADAEAAAKAAAEQRRRDAIARAAERASGGAGTGWG